MTELIDDGYIDHIEQIGWKIKDSEDNIYVNDPGWYKIDPNGNKFLLDKKQYNTSIHKAIIDGAFGSINLAPGFYGKLYFYKDKPYTILTESKFKMLGTWVDVVIYMCQYQNDDGMIWVREKKEFYDLFKEK